MSLTPDEASTVVHRLAAGLSTALIALDFDGTLAPIVPVPADSRPVPGVIDTLVELARAGCQIAIVTGRDAQTVIELGGLERIPGLVVSGLHSAETWQNGKLETRAEPAGIQQLRAALPALLATADPAVWLEDKRLSLVVHGRRAVDPERALDGLRRPVAELVDQVGLEMHPGKGVLEIRIPQLSKANAVHALLGDGIGAAMFAGDDLGDLPAFDAVHEWSTRTGRPGLTVAVGEVAEVQDAATLHVAAPEQLGALLRQLAGHDQGAGSQSPDKPR